MFVYTFKAQRQPTTTLCQDGLNLLYIPTFIHFAEFEVTVKILLFTPPFVI